MSPEAAYRETIEYLFALQKHGIKLALANSERLMELMGRPEGRFKSVHVAGTNGKGSTSAFIASVLRAAGYRVGLYTSPHLVDFTERIRINGEPISEAKVVELARRVREGYERGAQSIRSSLNPTFFEVTTAVAFSYFAEEGVDLAVIEAGMGGRLDSTNVVTPLVSVITNIDLEHMEFLGNTIERIAAEKAGIIKPGIPVVTGATQPEAVAVIERVAADKGAHVLLRNRDFRAERLVSGREQVFNYQGTNTAYKQLRLALPGGYQVENAALAVAAIERVRAAGVDVDEAALRSGLAQTRWEGRLERVAQNPDVYLDGAHNPASAKMLAGAVREMRPEYERVVLVLGILGDKDYRGIIAELVPLADHVIVTKPEYARAMDLSLLAAEARLLHGSVEPAATVALAIARARELASVGDLVLITGSLYIVGDARAELVGRQSKALSGLKG